MIIVDGIFPWLELPDPSDQTAPPWKNGGWINNLLAHLKIWVWPFRPQVGDRIRQAGSPLINFKIFILFIIFYIWLSVDEFWKIFYVIIYVWFFKNKSQPAKLASQPTPFTGGPMQGGRGGPIHLIDLSLITSHTKNSNHSNEQIIKSIW